MAFIIAVFCRGRDLLPMNSDTQVITRRIKRFAPLQLGKIMGVLYGGLGLLFAPIFLMAAVFDLVVPTGFGTLFGLGMAIATPILYGIAGFLSGLVGAWLYNLTAHFTGGMEIEFE